MIIIQFAAYVRDPDSTLDGWIAFQYDDGKSVLCRREPYGQGQLSIGAEHPAIVKNLFGDVSDKWRGHKRHSGETISIYVSQDTYPLSLLERWVDLLYSLEPATIADVRHALNVLLSVSGHLEVNPACFVHTIRPGDNWAFATVSNRWWSKGNFTVREAFEQLRIFELLDHLETTEQ